MTIEIVDIFPLKLVNFPIAMLNYQRLTRTNHHHGHSCEVYRWRLSLDVAAIAAIDADRWRSTSLLRQRAIGYIGKIGALTFKHGEKLGL